MQRMKLAQAMQWPECNNASGVLSCVALLCHIQSICCLLLHVLSSLLHTLRSLHLLHCTHSLCCMHCVCFICGMSCIALRTLHCIYCVWAYSGSRVSVFLSIVSNRTVWYSSLSTNFPWSFDHSQFGPVGHFGWKWVSQRPECSHALLQSDSDRYLKLGQLSHFCQFF